MTSLVAAAALLAGCARSAPDPRGALRTGDDFAASFAGAVEAAHGAARWRERAALESHIRVTFGGKTAIDGRLLFETTGGRSRLELADGTTLVFDGKHAWVTPPASEAPRARFHLLTWSYFLALPFKLRDPGTQLAPFAPAAGRKPGELVASLTFDPGVGDTPEDWYVVYGGGEDDRVRAVAYIVTYGTARAEAEREPHAATYEDYVLVDGVAVPRRLRFWHWDDERGPHGDAIGELVVGSLRFVTPAPGAFERPADAREDPLPGTAG